MRFEKISRIFILFLFIIITGSFNAQAASISLNISLLNVYAGQTFDVNVTVDPQGTAIAGAQLNITFNKSIINVNSITEGNLFKQNGANTFFSNGTINNSLGTVINIYGAILNTTGVPKNVSTQGTFIIINATAIGALDTAWINLTNVKIVDSNGTSVALNTPTPAPTSTQTASSGGGSSSNTGGGGGAGGASGENYTNIEAREKYDLYIFKDITTSYIFRKTDPIVFINITGNTNAGEINVAVEVLRNTSSLVKTPPEDPAFKYGVYRNVNIWVGTYGFATPTNIKNAEITFRVTKSWIEANNIDPDSITMMRYDNVWQSLPTQKISENDAHLYYKASTNSFSPFAITGKAGVQQYSWVYPETSSTESTGQQEETNKSNASESEPPASLSNYLLIGVFAGIIANSILCFKIRKASET